MTELCASRTLVKSPPELWAECSDAASLARHLGRFGEIRITRLDPETVVAWEGEHARGTVRIEPAGWGTKVILTAVAVGEEVVPPEPADPPAPVGVTAEPAEPQPESVQPSPVEPEPVPAVEAAESVPRRRRLARLMAWLRGPDPVPYPRPTEAVTVLEAEQPLATPEPAQAPRLAATEPPEASPLAATAPADGPPPPVSAEQPAPAPDTDAEAALAAALDSLGQAHHRPYSRA